MFNHARSLLMNLDGDSVSQREVYPGDVIIPAEYRAVSLPSYLESMRQQLFGAMPDRAFLNYRVFQLLQLAESTELRNWFHTFDTRLTYRLDAITSVFSPDVFYPVVTPAAGNTAKLTLHGEGMSPDMLGRSRFEYSVEVTDVNTVTVTHVTGLSGAKTYVQVVELVEQLSPLIELPLSGYSVRLSGLQLGNFWNIIGFLQPTSTLPGIETTLRQIGETNLVQLFGLAGTEPYTTFQNCWERHPDFAYRLTGLVAAVVHRTEEYRLGQ